MGDLFAGRFARQERPEAEGAHGALYKVVDIASNNRIVALKVFSPSRRLDDRVLMLSWSKELEAYQQVGEHDNLVRLVDWGRGGEGNDTPYLAFEWVGPDLFERLRDLSLEGWDDLWPILHDILSGLDVLHQNSFVHRDIKPENILVSEDSDRYKIADFGTTRLIETVSVGMTMALLGTEPYAPPERGTRNPTAAYDIYSIGMLVTQCLSAESIIDDPMGYFQALDLPSDVHAVLERCLLHEPADRPQSAGVLLAELAALQLARETSRGNAVEIFVDFVPRALEAFAASQDLNIDGARSRIKEDFGDPVFAFDRRDANSGEPDLQIVGQTLMIRAVRHRGRGGVVRGVRVMRPPAQVLELARSKWFKPSALIRFSFPIDAATSEQNLQRFLHTVADQDADRLEMEAQAASDAGFPSWRSILNAKFQIESNRGAPVLYTAFRVEGSRVFFTISGSPDVEVGEGRLVRVGNRRVLFGEVEGVEGNEIRLYVTRRQNGSIPRNGTLEFDSEASKSKLRREQNALERVSARKSVRPDLREILESPSLSRPPTNSPDLEYLQLGLDSAKQKAVQTALGSPDFTLIQGPPGTGKTTFIAELVAQQLRKDPTSRVVVASQTHIALDNALTRIQNLVPDALLLRLGQVERFSEGVEGLGLDSQMDSWRESVTRQSREFVRAAAEEMGLAVDAVDVDSIATELNAQSESATAARSRVVKKQAERKALLAELSSLRAKAPAVMDAAELVERSSKSSAVADLVNAAQRFVAAGIELAATLESSDTLGRKLVELEATLNELRDRIRTEAKRESQLKAELASELGVSTELSAEELIKLVRQRPPATNPRLDNLLRIAADWKERISGTSAEFVPVLVSRAQVVAATCVGLTGVRGVEAVPFDLCIIDEASKATATEVLVPLANSRRWVLVGDDRQLPPFVEMALESAEILKQNDITREDVRQTLFTVLNERLPEDCKVSLTHQHRMNPVIGRLISSCFYENKLTSAERELSKVVGMGLSKPVRWLDTSGRNDRRETRGAPGSISNRGEARTIRRLLDRLQWVAARESETVEVVVLTGYQAQRSEITSTIASGELERPNLKVRVATVDSFQGQEADIAIFSATRSNDDGKLGFLTSVERINVALSRARDGLVVVGDTEFVDSFGGGTPLHSVLSYIRNSPDCDVEVVE